jgi:DNA-binding transcriptional MerR regulator
MIPEPRRSSREIVRNPLLALPEIQALLDLPPESRQAIAKLAQALARSKRQEAEHSWRTNKGPMALYHKWAGVQARHLAQILKRSLKPGPPPTAWPT